MQFKILDESIGDSLGGSIDDFIDDDDGAGYALDIEKPQDLKKYYENGKKKAIKELYKGINFIYYFKIIDIWIKDRFRVLLIISSTLVRFKSHFSPDQLPCKGIVGI